jgi:hypothetical protein
VAVPERDVPAVVPPRWHIEQRTEARLVGHRRPPPDLEMKLLKVDRSSLYLGKE